MSKKRILVFLSLLLFQSCKLHTAISTFKKNENIDVATRQEIKTLNDRLFNGIIKNDVPAIKALMSPELLGLFGHDTNNIINTISAYKADSYSILDEWAIQASAAGVNITLPSINADDNDYFFVFQAPVPVSYVSLLLLKNSDTKFLMTAIYGKSQNEWKLNLLMTAQYSLFGKTAPDYLKLARTSYRDSSLINAIDYISLANMCMKPAGARWQYVKELEMREFGDTLMKEITAKYQFPLTLTTIDSKPEIFRIFPQKIKEGYFPMVCYLTQINLGNFVALKAENKRIKKEVNSIFPGIDRDKKFVLYAAFNELPNGLKPVEHYGFVDSALNK